MLSAFEPSARFPAHATNAHWFVFRGNRLLVALGDGRAMVPRVTALSELGVAPVRTQFLGHLAGTPCYSAELDPAASTPAGYQFHELRRLYPLLQEPIFWVAARAIQIVDWDRTHQFCGRCGAAMDARPDEHVKVCVACGLTNYPRLAPAVIVAVEKEDRLLLAQNTRHPAGFYSVLAGFVEAGETLEQTVQREVKEEVGIDVTDIRYFGSQPWPFPHSLMIGFTARYAGGDLVLQESEIEDAGWYSADTLPQVPPPLSIARRLIDDFVRRNRTTTT